MKNILISAAGTASAYHIIETLRRLFSEHFIVHICDINPPNLIAASKLCDVYHVVPLCNDHNYREFMLDLFRKNEIDVYVPLIDADIILFPQDDIELNKICVYSAAPILETIDKFKNKKSISNFLNSIDIPTPKQFKINEIDVSKEYFIKPINGFGSKGAIRASGKYILDSEINNDGFVIEEICNGPEITVELFFRNQEIFYIIRERIETKEGVCTKCKFIHDNEIDLLIKKIVKLIKLPVVSCVQFMKLRNNWVVTDFNLRIGAGTALSSAIGCNFAAAAACVWGNLEVDPLNYLRPYEKEQYVVRVYKEVVM